MRFSRRLHVSFRAAAAPPTGTWLDLSGNAVGRGRGRGDGGADAQWGAAGLSALTGLTVMRCATMPA
jgi:hypothetical protein